MIPLLVRACLSLLGIAVALALLILCLALAAGAFVAAAKVWP